MNRENNYLVLKYKDIKKYLNDVQKAQLMSIVSDVNFARQQEDRGLLNAVVVEHDWPEYEPTWKAIENRVDGIDDGVEFLNPTNEMIQQSQGQWYKFAAFILNKLAPEGVSITVDDMKPFEGGDKCVLAHGHPHSIDFKIVTRAEAEKLAALDACKTDKPSH